MYAGKTILALIPARGGSKGLPRKNILPLLGKPLIGWTIEQARASELLDEIVVSTDDAEIAETAAVFGAPMPFMRPAALASDTSLTLDVVEHALAFYADHGRTFDYLALLEPTSPLRAPGDIDAAIATLVDAQHRSASLVSVGEVHMEHPSIVKRIENGFVAPYDREAAKVTRRQDLPAAYFPYGVIYLARLRELVETRSFYQDTTLPYFIERWQNYEVDDEYDFACVEAVLRCRTKGSE